MTPSPTNIETGSVSNTLDFFSHAQASNLSDGTICALMRRAPSRSICITPTKLITFGCTSNESHSVSRTCLVPMPLCTLFCSSKWWTRYFPGSIATILSPTGTCINRNGSNPRNAIQVGCLAGCGILTASSSKYVCSPWLTGIKRIRKAVNKNFIHENLSGCDECSVAPPQYRAIRSIE